MGLLRFMGLNVLSYTADLDDEERAAMVADFNNDELVIHAMFLGLSNNITGMNLQKCCTTGIALMYTFTPSLLSQAIKRIHRIGTTQPVFWSILKLSGSYHELQERMLHVKQAQFIDTQSQLSDRLQGEVRDILCFELAREIWGTLESKYAWVKHAEDITTIIDFGAAWVPRYAKAYSMVASLVLQAMHEEMRDED